MRILLVVLVIALLGVSLVQAQDETPEPMPTNALIRMAQNTQVRLQTQSEDWYLAFVSNRAANTRLTWFQECCRAVITLEEIRVCCESKMATTFSYDENMLPYYQDVLGNFAPFELIQSCEVDGIRVHEFTGESNTYYIRHYHEENGLTVRNTGLYFPEQEELERYSRLFFPDIACPDEPTESAPQADD